ncbi:MAG: membrane protein insertion efficiency factor YidD [Candidatus Marinimicrobia bacterium]|nr:membrane protein insertion efficiency factor YidD [Candidatus Neomarinimicrobiota bacterium]
MEKTAILPIAAWQRISHNTNLLNCQFYPSCSQYGAMAIKENGILKGLPMTADRIVRCNPSAFFNHIHINGKFHQPDNRLVDHLQPDREISNSKSPVLAGLFSALLPGAGRVYAGKWFDGLMGFIMVYLTAASAIESSKRGNMFNKVFSYSIAGVFYTGEIYGAYRSAKYYQQ